MDYGMHHPRRINEALTSECGLGTVASSASRRARASSECASSSCCQAGACVIIQRIEPHVDHRAQSTPT